MQTFPFTNSFLSERHFQLDTHIQPASGGPMPGFSRLHELTQPAALPLAAIADSKPRDVSSRFGARLRELRRERNLTQARMANAFGIDRSFISDVERGRKSISLPMLEVIALGMNLTLSDLLQNI